MVNEKNSNTTTTDIKSDMELLDEAKNNTEQTVEYIPIENTPFTAGRQDNKWYLLMGKYRLTEELNSFEEVKEASEVNDWFRIMQICTIMINENETVKKLEKDIFKIQEHLILE